MIFNAHQTLPKMVLFSSSSEPGRHAVEMHASAIKALGKLDL